MALFKNKYRVESTRLQNWDYGWNGKYFITIVTKNREHFFGEIDENQQMILSKTGDIASNYWYEIPDHFPFVVLDEFVVMPNHIHGIVIIDKKPGSTKSQIYDSHRINDGRDKACLVSTTKNNQSHKKKLTPGQKRFRNPGQNNISTIIGSCKSVITNHAHKINPVFDWQSRFHDHIIRDSFEFTRIKSYIRNNPKNWENDKFNQ